jgi:hypothetical protein
VDSNLLLNQSVDTTPGGSVSKIGINKFTTHKKKRKLTTPVLYQFFGPTSPPMEKIIALRILEFLENKDLYNISQTNSLWDKAAMDDALWE